MTTRADVAVLAKVSPAVVSYVINGGPRPVSDAARARVLAAIETLDYRPNAVASSLRRGSTRGVGLLLEDALNPYFAQLATALSDQLAQAGYSATLAIAPRGRPSRLKALQAFLAAQLDGMILLSSTAVRDFEAMRGPTPAVVAIDRTSSSSPVSTVTVDNVEDAAYAVEYLQHWGHTRIACITGTRDVALSRERLRGWRRQQQQRSAPHDNSLIAYAEFTGAGGAAAFDGLLTHARNGPPTSVFVSSDIQAFGVLHRCHQIGLRVPEDMSVMSFDGTSLARFTVPTLTTMRQPLDEIATAATEILVDRIITPELPPVHRVLRGHLVLGATCAHPRDEAKYT